MKIAFRNFLTTLRRYKISSLLNVIGLTLAFTAFVGMLIIGVMNNILNTVGVPTFLCEAVKGLIIIFAVLLQKKDSN